MYKIIGLIAATAIVGAAGLANAADGQDKSAKKMPAELSAAEMGAVTAGVGRNGGSLPTSQFVTAGSFTLVFDGTTWVRQTSN